MRINRSDRTGDSELLECGAKETHRWNRFNRVVERDVVQDFTSAELLWTHHGVLDNGTFHFRTTIEDACSHCRHATGYRDSRE